MWGSYPFITDLRIAAGESLRLLIATISTTAAEQIGATLPKFRLDNLLIDQSSCRVRFNALRQHGFGHGVAWKALQNSAIGTLRRYAVARLERVSSNPSHRAQLLILIADPEFWIVATAKREQFINQEFGLAAFHLDPLQRPRQHLVPHLFEHAIADADRGVCAFTASRLKLTSGQDRTRWRF